MNKTAIHLPPLWQFRRENTRSAYIMEPLEVPRVKYPHPWACYLNTIIFYDADWQEQARIESTYQAFEMMGAPAFLYDGHEWQSYGGTVFFEDGWWFAYRCYRRPLQD